MGRDARVYLLGSILDVLGILVRQSVLCQYGVHLHVIVALLAQYVDDFADDVLRVFRRPLGNAYHGFLAILAALQLLLGYQDVVDEDITFCNEEGEVFLYF